MGETASSLPPERPPIDAYGDLGFRIRGARHEGSQLILPAAITSWPVSAMEELRTEHLAAIAEIAAEIEILILGTGIKFVRPAPDIRFAVERAGIGLEAMDTGAACRTYNVLLAERRRIAAALIAVP